jgi:hypothetical protein
MLAPLVPGIQLSRQLFLSLIAAITNSICGFAHHWTAKTEKAS